MISALFRTNNTLLTTVALVLLGLLLTLAGTMTSLPYMPGLEADFVQGWLRSWPQWLQWVVSFLALVVPAWLLNLLFTDMKLGREAHGWFGLAYLLIAGSVTEWLSFHPAVLCTPLFAYILRNLMIVSSSPRQLQLVFDAGFLASLCFLLYQPAAVLFPATLLGIILGGVFRLRALLVWLLGYATPLYLLAGGLYLTGHLELLQGWFDFDLLFTYSLRELSDPQKLLAALGLSMLFFGLLMSFTSVNMKTNALRNTQRMFLILLGSALVAVLLMPGDSWYIASLFIPIGAFFLGRFLESVQPVFLLDLLLLVWAGVLVWSLGIF